MRFRFPPCLKRQQSIGNGLVEAEASNHKRTEIAASSHQCRDDCELLTIHERHNAIPGSVLC